MKKFVVCLVWATGVFASHPEFNQPHTVENTDIFLSFMRSGTNWLFTCIQALTNKPLYYVEHGGTKTYSIRSGINHLGVSLDQNKKPLYHTHIFNLAGQLPKSNRLLLILRNYKEVFIRRIRDNPQDYAHLIKRNKQFYAYCSYLKVFDSWDPQKRLLIYYEDLILKPRETLKSVLDFLEESDHKLDPFMKHFESYRKKTVQSYHKVQNSRGGSMSKGIDVLYHSKLMPTSLLRATDQKMKKCYPLLWSRYLTRYETTNEVGLTHE